MEFKDLYNFGLIIIIIALIVGVGVLTLDKFGTAVKEDRTATNEGIAMVSQAGTTTHDDVQSVSDFSNASDTWAIGTDLNFTTAGAITGSANVTDATYNITYIYEDDTAATTAIWGGRDEVSNINTTWLGLIITIAILALILGLVVQGYGGLGGRK